MTAMNNTTRYRLLSVPHLPTTVGSGKSVVNYTINNYNGGNCGCYGNALFGYGFNTCGCGFGNIGNYFKFGLGMGLANLATGLLSTGFNWLMGGITTGNWNFGSYRGGIGGYGMGGYGYGNYWGGGSDYSSARENGKVRSKNDIDNAKFAPLITKIRGLKNDNDLTPAKIQAVYKEILDDIKNTDNNHKDSDVATYQALLNDLDDIINDKGYTVDKKTGAVTDPNAATAPKGAKGGGQVAGQAQAGQVAGKVPETADDSEKINVAADIDELKNINYDNLSESDKQAYITRAKNLLNNLDKTGEELNSEIKKLPEEVRIAIKKAYYSEGYANPTTLDEVKNQPVALAHDTGSVDDNVPADIIHKDGSDAKLLVDGKTVTLETESGINVKYTYKETVDGEMIYESDKNNQLYVLQKNADGKYVLNQYKYHKGYDEPDVKG